MTEAYLRLQGLTKSYNGRDTVIRGVDLDIRKGEFVSFLGPSGSGKTTTLMMIAGFEQPDSGDIRLDGRSLLSVKPHRRNIGMVFQNYALFPHLTVGRNVAYPLTMRGVASAEIAARVSEALALVGLAHLSERRPAELSGGQQQRVALARALIFKPDVLLLDEPLGALDKQLREQMQIEIKRIHTEIGVTTIYVTHDQSEAMTLSDRVAVFHDGRIEQIDAPTAIYLKPKTRFVGGFIGDSNFFDAVLRGPGEGTLDVAGLGSVQAAPVPDWREGQRVEMLVRPEMVQILANGQAPANSFEMQVASVIHYGDSVLLVGSVKGAKLRLRAPGVGAARFRPGDILRVGWGASDSHLIARDESRP